MRDALGLVSLLLILQYCAAGEPQTRNVGSFDSAGISRAIAESQAGDTVQLAAGVWIPSPFSSASFAPTKAPRSSA
jgi:hypothetical protein